MYNFVAPKFISDEFKKSRWFKTNLGRNVSLRDKDQTRFEINPEDKFVKYYFDKYKVLIQSEGAIGSLGFFTDYYINGQIVAVYYKDKEFIFEHNKQHLLNNGIDDYIGSIIKEIEVKYIQEVENADDIKINTNVDPDKLITNPGSVTWADILAMKQKQKNNS